MAQWIYIGTFSNQFEIREHFHFGVGSAYYARYLASKSIVSVSSNRWMTVNPSSAASAVRKANGAGVGPPYSGSFPSW